MLGPILNSLHALFSFNLQTTLWWNYFLLSLLCWWRHWGSERLSYLQGGGRIWAQVCLTAKHVPIPLQCCSRKGFLFSCVAWSRTYILLHTWHSATLSCVCFVSPVRLSTSSAHMACFCFWSVLFFLVSSSTLNYKRHLLSFLLI